MNEDGSGPISVVYNIRNAYGTFSEKEKTIADFIIKNSGTSADPSITELAVRIGISEATLVRFVKKIGYPGYQKFRLALARETSSASSRIFEIPVNADEDVVDSIFRHTIQTLESCKKMIDRGAVLKTVADMLKARNILLCGVGGSNINARDAFHKLVRTGLSCQYTDDFHMQLMLAAQAGPDDLAIVFSHLGNNYDTISLADGLECNGCPVTLVTSYADSPLGRMADTVLQVSPVHSSMVAESFSAGIAVAVLINVLYVEVMNQLGEKGLENLNKMRKAIAGRRA
jgi:RpiR family transcriptional regulator, carbohydrate utilization regulator